MNVGFGETRLLGKK